MAEATAKKLEDIGSQSEDLSRVLRDEGASSQEKADARKELNELSKQAGDLRKTEVDKISDPKEKQIIELYEKGTQTYAIAQQVYDGMVNTETVGRVVGVVRKHYNPDFNEQESINDYKGYSGV